ncbi:hypothetical protein [Chryseobacterium lacus]|nr:hypothetical protein [Chryseobacterium lacus]
MKTDFLFSMLIFMSCLLSAQRRLPLDSAQILGTTSFSADDYGNIYFYKNKELSFTKVDSLGKLHGRMLLITPYKVQNVQNPMNITLFSENAQQIKFIDQNLNEIQKIDLRRFGFIKMAYAEDLQQIWLLDESTKRLLQYNFREDRIIHTIPFPISFDEIKEMLIFNNKVYFIRKNQFLVYDLKARQLFAETVDSAVKLRRENDRIYIIGAQQIFQYLPDNPHLKTVFHAPKATNVDKNSSAYFEIRGNNVYLYLLK